jgi:hypothetical protein
MVKSMSAKFSPLISVFILLISCSNKTKKEAPVTILKEGITKEIVINSKRIMEQFYPFGDYPYSNTLFSFNYRLHGKMHTPVTNGVIYNDEVNTGCCISLRTEQAKNKIYIVGLNRILLIEADGFKHKISEREIKKWSIKREELSYGVGFTSMTEVIDLDLIWQNAEPSDEILSQIDKLL